LEKSRKDVKVEEGQVIQAKHDIKGDVLAGAIGTGGGTLAGAVFSHVRAVSGIGLIGSTAYILSRKGKEVDLPAQQRLRFEWTTRSLCQESLPKWRGFARPARRAVARVEIAPLRAVKLRNAESRPA